MMFALTGSRKVKRLFIFLLFVSLVFVKATSGASAAKINVPYIHQRYDALDDFNGAYACAPASAVMILAYYDRLEPRSDTASYPHQHMTPYGYYLSETYSYKEHEFNEFHQEPGACGTAESKGAFGYIWQGSVEGCRACGVFPRMKEYLKMHDMEIEFYPTPKPSEARKLVKREIEAGRPVIARNQLTESGHYVVVVGYKRSDGDFLYLVNDPTGYDPIQEQDPCFGCYKNECPQPVNYSYSELKLDVNYRGLLTIKPENIDKENEKKKQEQEFKNHGYTIENAETVVKDEAGLISEGRRNNLKTIIRNYQEESGNLIRILTLNDSFRDEEKAKKVIDRSLEELEDYLIENSQEKNKNSGFFSIFTNFFGLLGGNDGPCVVLNTIIEQGKAYNRWSDGCGSKYSFLDTEEYRDILDSSKYDHLADKMVKDSIDHLPDSNREMKSDKSDKNNKCGLKEEFKGGECVEKELNEHSASVEGIDWAEGAFLDLCYSYGNNRLIKRISPSSLVQFNEQLSLEFNVGDELDDRSTMISSEYVNQFCPNSLDYKYPVARLYLYGEGNNQVTGFYSLYREERDLEANNFQSYQLNAFEEDYLEQIEQKLMKRSGKTLIESINEGADYANFPWELWMGLLKKENDVFNPDALSSSYAAGLFQLKKPSWSDAINMHGYGGKSARDHFGMPEEPGTSWSYKQAKFDPRKNIKVANVFLTITKNRVEKHFPGKYKSCQETDISLNGDKRNELIIQSYHDGYSGFTDLLCRLGTLKREQYKSELTTESKNYYPKIKQYSFVYRGIKEKKGIPGN